MANSRTGINSARPPRHPERGGRRPSAACTGSPWPCDGAERPCRRRRHDGGQGPSVPGELRPHRPGRAGRQSGRYALGPLALQLGLISLQQADPVRVAAPLLPELAARTGHTVALVVWGGRGPTIVLREASPSAVHVDMRHGTVFSIAGTASGRLFAAHLPPTSCGRSTRPSESRRRRRARVATARQRDRAVCRPGARSRPS